MSLCFPFLIYLSIYLYKYIYIEWYFELLVLLGFQEYLNSKCERVNNIKIKITLSIPCLYHKHILLDESGVNCRKLLIYFSHLYYPASYSSPTLCSGVSWVAFTWVFMALPRVAGTSGDWKLVTPEGFGGQEEPLTVLFRVGVVIVRAKAACTGKVVCVQV